MGRRGPRLHDHVAKVRVRHPVLHHKRRDPRFANALSRDLPVLHGSHVSVVRRPSDCHATVRDFCPLMLDRSSQLTCVPNLQGAITRIQAEGHCGNSISCALVKRTGNCSTLLIILNGDCCNRCSFTERNRGCIFCSCAILIRGVINLCTTCRASNRHVLRTHKVPALRRNDRGCNSRVLFATLLNFQVLIPVDARRIISLYCSIRFTRCRVHFDNLRPNQRRSLRHGIGNGVAVLRRRAAHSGDVAVVHRDAAGINPGHPGVAAVVGFAAGDGDARSRTCCVSSTINKGQSALHEDAVAAIGLFRRTLNLIIVTDQFDGQVMLGVNAAGVLNHRSVLAAGSAGDVSAIERQRFGGWVIGDTVLNRVFIRASNLCVTDPNVVLFNRSNFYIFVACKVSCTG